MTIIPMWVLLPKTQFNPICATKLRTSRSCHPEMETLIPMPLKASFCLKMASTLTLGFQTRCEEAWLDPKNIPKTPNLRRYDRKTRATSNTHTQVKQFRRFLKLPDLVIWFYGSVLIDVWPPGVVLFVAGCVQESIVQVTPQGTEPRRGRNERGRNSSTHQLWSVRDII